MNENHGTTAAITVLLADDHPIVRAGLRMLLDKEDGMALVAEAGDGAEALESIERFSPQVSVLDIEMPLMSGMDVLREIRKQRLSTLPVVLTLHDDRDLFERCIELGAQGYLVKDTAPRDIVRCIRRVAAGDNFLGGVSGNTPEADHHKRKELLLALESLSASERRVLRLVAEDKSTREIADALFVSKRTIDSHRLSICSKLGLSGCFSLIRFAADNRPLLDEFC